MKTLAENLQRPFINSQNFVMVVFVGTHLRSQRNQSAFLFSTQNISPNPKVLNRVSEDGPTPLICCCITVVSDCAERTSRDVIPLFGAIQKKVIPTSFRSGGSLRSTLRLGSRVVNLAELGKGVEVFSDNVLADDAIANYLEELFRRRDAK